MSRTWEPRRQVWTGASPRSPYTVEGMIDGLGDFSRGANRARGWRRRVAQVLALWIVGPFILGFAVVVVYLAVALVRAALP